MHVSYRLHNLRIFVFHLNVYLKVDTSLSIYIFIDVFKAKIYMQFHVQVHRDGDGCKRILFALFYKSTMFRCYYECTNLNVESLHI